MDSFLTLIFLFLGEKGVSGTPGEPGTDGTAGPQGPPGIPVSYYRFHPINYHTTHFKTMCVCV